MHHYNHSCVELVIATRFGLEQQALQEKFTEQFFGTSMCWVAIARRVGVGLRYFLHIMLRVQATLKKCELQSEYVMANFLENGVMCLGLKLKCAGNCSKMI